MWRLPGTALVFVSFLAACAGQTVGGSTGGGGGGSIRSSSSSGGGGGSGGIASSGGGGDACVDIDLSTYDLSCETSSDCVVIASGTVCSDSCSLACPGSTINASGLARYVAATSSLSDVGYACGCPLEGSPTCANNTCVMCTGIASIDPPGCDGTESTPDAGSSCVYVDLSTYDVSCQMDTDCVQVTGGEICTDGCSCGGSTINIDGQARYSSAVSSVSQGQSTCPCPAEGSPRCIQGTCRICGPGTYNKCGDAG